MQNYRATVLDVNYILVFCEGMEIVNTVHQGREALGVIRGLQVSCPPSLSCFGTPERWGAGQFERDLGVRDERPDQE